MKNLTPYLFTLLFFFFIHSVVSGQEKECGAILPENFIPVKYQFPSKFDEILKRIRDKSPTQRSLTGSCVNYAPIKAHIIRRSNGSGGYSVTDLNAAIDLMNVRYESACMAFYLCDGINYIDNDAYYDFDDSDEGALTSANNVTGLINIYFANSVGSGSSFYCGYAYFPGGPDVIMMDNSCANNGSTLTHEMGHFYGMPHTHSGGTELVDGSNCASAGDRFCDTPADPRLGSSNVNSSCIYVDNSSTDANNDLYQPNPRNIMSYSRKACRDYFSPEQLATASLNFTDGRNYFACASFDVDFTVDITASCTAPLTVQFTEEAVGESSYAWDFDNNGSVDATGPNPSHTFTTEGSYDVRLEISNATQTIGKVKNGLITILSENLPYESDMESFESSTSASGLGGGWTTFPNGTTGAFRWNTTTGHTPSDNTGPIADHTLASSVGTYLFTEASGYTQGDIATLTSPCLFIPNALLAVEPMVGFYYHMYGASMGTLHIDLHDGTNWINDVTPAISGEQQATQTSDWLQKTFSAKDYQGDHIQIRFRAERGGGFTSDIAIDDFTMFNQALLPVELVDFKGSSDGSQIHKLNWQTATEIGSAHFIVEHSTDGINFQDIHKEKAQGDSQELVSYQFKYLKPIIGLNYYRLKMVDLDGSFDYSSIIQLTDQGEKELLRVYPNPTNKDLHIDRANADTKWVIEIYDALGKQIKTEEMNIGERFKDIDLLDLKGGMFHIRVMENDILMRTLPIVKL